MATSLLNLFAPTHQLGEGSFDTEGMETQAESGAFPRTEHTPSIEGYEIVREIGRGGMGVIYLARDQRLKRQVAIKMLLDPEFASQEQRQRFRTEAESVAKLRHPHIVQVHELGETRGSGSAPPHPYMVLEYIEGPTLQRCMIAQRMGPRQSAALLIIVARAVQHAHDQGLIHRDLKPANILLQQCTSNSSDHLLELAGYLPKVTDFGLVKPIVMEGQAGLSLTRPDYMVGTPQYMAPEQTRGNAHRPGPSVDVYALGVILYQMLTGQVPFDDVDIVKLMMEAQTQEPIAPRKHNGTIPIDLETICLKCLEKDPHRRYLSAAALADDLARYLHDEPIHARAVSDWQRLAKWAKRRPAIASLLLILGTTILAALTAIFVLWRQAESDRTVAIQKKQEAEEVGEQARAADRAKGEALYQSRLHQAATLLREGSLNKGRQLLDSCRRTGNEPDRRGWEWHYLNGLCAPYQHVLKAKEFPLRSLDFHPHRRILVGAEGVFENSSFDSNKTPGTLQIWFEKEGEWIPAPDKDWDCALNWARFTSDGQYLMVFDSKGRLHVLDSEKPHPQSPWRRIRTITLGGEVKHTRSGKLYEMKREAGRCQIRVHDIKEDEPIATVTVIAEVAHWNGSEDGRFVGVTATTGKFQLWSITDQKVVIEKHFPQGEYWESCLGERGEVFLLRENRKGELAWYQGDRLLLHQKMHSVSGLRFAGDGRTLAVLAGGFEGEEILVYHMDSRGEVDPRPRVLHGHRGAIHHFGFRNDGKRLASTGTDSSVRIWNTDPQSSDLGKCERVFWSHQGAATMAAFDPHGPLLASTGIDTHIYLWDPEHAVEGNLIRIEHPRRGAFVNAISFYQDAGQLVQFTCDTQTLTRYDSATGKVLAENKLKDVNAQVSYPRYDTAFNQDGTMMACCSEDRRKVKLWASGSGTLLWESPELPYRITQIQFSGDGKRMLVSGRLMDPAEPAKPLRTSLCQVLDVQTREKIFEQESTLPYTAGCLNEKGTRLALTTQDPSFFTQVKVVDVESQRIEYSFHMPETWTFSACFSPDERYLAISNFAGRQNTTENVWLFDAKTGSQLHQMSGPVEVTSVRFTPDSSRLLAVGYDSQVCFFDVKTGADLLTLQPLSTPRLADWASNVKVVFSPSGNEIAVNSWDGYVTVWRTAESKKAKQ